MSSSSPYSPAAFLLTQIWTTRKSLKTLAYDKKGNLRCNKATYAQVCHVLENREKLEQVLEQVPFSNVRNEGLLYVLLYELLLGPNKKIRGGGALKRQILKKESELQHALNQVLQQEHSGASSVVTCSFPRYVRVNTLLTTTQEVIKELKSQQSYEEMYVDQHVPNLLVLPPATSIHQHSLITSGKVILQDKSSCFSALCLIHGNSSTGAFRGDLLDACAAPGNKTSHLAALVSDGETSSPSTIYALDRSSTRLESLQRRMQQLVNNTKNVNVVTQHLDFLKTDPSNYDKVRGILLDPSCSGSGIFTSPDRLNELPDEQRITSLSNFQLVALKHSMSFPHVERIVYSTCSLYEQENECVVSQALQDCNMEWQLVAPACLQHWKRRGHAVDGLSKDQADCLIRANREDETNGFFVAYLERRNKSARSHDSTEEKKATIVPPKGLTLYNGEFAKDKVMVPAEQESQSDETSSTAASVDPKSKQTAAKPGKKNKVIGKKRAKKVAWKRKQMEQKLRRIEKKNATTTTSNEQDDSKE